MVSVVSHGHGRDVQRLLGALAQPSARVVRRVVLTQNLPESEPKAPDGGWPFVLQVVRNAQALGFGVNHNKALQGAEEDCVCVLNPDVEWLGDAPFAALCRDALQPAVGCAYPLQTDAQGRVQASERHWPTPSALWKRRVQRQAETQRVDWVNAACLVMARPVWEAVGGFDERYFMYCEDVDLCARLRLRGLELRRSAVQVVHAGQRASSRNLRHLVWHLQSLWRLWRSPAFVRAQQLLTQPGPSASRIDAR